MKEIKHMTRYQHLEARIEVLENTIRELTGKPRGPITYREAEQAMRNGDGGRMLEKYIEQLVRKGGNGKDRVSGAGRESATQ